MNERFNYAMTLFFIFQSTLNFMNLYERDILAKRIAAIEATTAYQVSANR